MKLSPVLVEAITAGVFSYAEVLRVQWMAALYEGAPAGTRVTYGGDMKDLLDRIELYLEWTHATIH